MTFSEVFHQANKVIEYTTIDQSEFHKLYEFLKKVNDVQKEHKILFYSFEGSLVDDVNSPTIIDEYNYINLIHALFNTHRVKHTMSWLEVAIKGLTNSIYLIPSQHCKNVINSQILMNYK